MSLTHRPSPGQSLYTYYFNHIAIKDKLKCKFSEEDKISLILGGIGLRPLIDSAEAGGISTLYELGNFLRNKSAPGKLVEEKLAVNCNTKIKCYACGLLGHKRYECRNKNKVCDLCGTMGRVKGQCSSYWEFKENTYVVSEAVDQKFNKMAKINEIRCKVFVDFGSSCSIIERHLLVRLSNVEFIKLEKPVTLCGFLGQSIAVEQAIMAYIQLDQVALYCKMYVVDRLKLSCPVLIGRNFTENKAIIYTL